MTSTTLLDEKLRELAQFEPTDLPVLSLYLNTQADQHGRANFDSFVRKEFKGRVATYPLRSRERDSFEADAQRIADWCKTDLHPSTNGVAIFACSGANGFFEALQLDAPIEHHQLYVQDQPHLFTLARLRDQYPAYAAVIADTNSARIFVFGVAATIDSDTITGTKVRSRSQIGGWSQARYQRNAENYHLTHSKEVLDQLDKIVRTEKIEHVIFAGDEVILPVLREQLSPFLREKVVDELKLDITTPEHVILKTTLEAMRSQDGRGDREEVTAMIDAYRSGGLAVAGLDDVLAALELGQVDVLFLGASAGEFEGDEQDGGGSVKNNTASHADNLVTKANQTAARVRFVEDTDLLTPVGGVGATLRYRI